MALVNCKECGKEISDQAQACPFCGIPLRPQPRPVAPEKRITSGASGCLILIVLLLVIMAMRSCGEDDTRPARSAPAPAASDVPLRAAAIQKFSGISAIRHAEWVDNELWLAVTDNGSPWRPVADQACAWLRGQGMTGDISVNVVDAAALANKRSETLAHSRCN